LDLSKQISFLTTANRCSFQLEKKVFLSIPKKERIEKLLEKMFDEDEFLSDYGIRSLSRFHASNPLDIFQSTVQYLPGESDSGMFGGNSNWRGPIWFPVNYLLIESLERLHSFYGNNLLCQFPAKTGHIRNCYDACIDICERLSSLFLPLPDGRRPCNGDEDIFKSRDNWKDLVLFYEHFHGCSGRGLGASHQTGWTALVVNCLFKIAAYRRDIHHKLSEKANLWVKENLTSFHPESWKGADLVLWEINKTKKTHGYSGVNTEDMMKDLFEKCPWKYISLVHKMAKAAKFD